MEPLTCRIDAASARGGAWRSSTLVFHARRRVPAVHTCYKGSRKVVRFCSLAHLRLIGRTTVSGRSNQMWSVPHRVMLKFESLPRPAIRATGPCRMQRQLIEKSYGFMGPGIGPPRLRARSALREKSSCGRDSSGMAGGWSGSAGGSNLAEPGHPLALPFSRPPVSRAMGSHSRS